MSLVDDEPMPAPKLSELEFNGLPRDGGLTWDPAEKAFVATRTTQSWFRTEDSIIKGDCTILREIAARWVERVWYAPRPDHSVVCIRGERISTGFVVVNQEVCVRDRNLVAGRRWEEVIDLGSEVGQHFRYVKANGDAADDIWLTD
jgi:hypothetical protein